MSNSRSVVEPKSIPPEIDRWNWGAFLLNWIWGVGNNTFIALLTLVPLVGFIMPFVLGAKGSRWAWRNGRWDSVEHFKRVQSKWAIWGVVVWLGAIALFGAIFGGTFLHSQPFRGLPARRGKAGGNPVAANLLGTPIVAGRPFGSIKISNGAGNGSVELLGQRPARGGHRVPASGEKGRRVVAHAAHPETRRSR